MNKMEKVAEILGVGLQQLEDIRAENVFQDEQENKYVLTPAGLLINDSGYKKADPRILLEFLTGERKVIIPLFKPQEGSLYVTYIGEKWDVSWDVWLNSMTDYFRLNSGAVFRTTNEAYKKRSEIYKKLTGREWE